MGDCVVGDSVKPHTAAIVKVPVVVFTVLSTDTRKVPPLSGGVNWTDESVAEPPHAAGLLSLVAMMAVPSPLYTLITVSNDAPEHVLSVTAD